VSNLWITIPSNSEHRDRKRAHSRKFAPVPILDRDRVVIMHYSRNSFCCALSPSQRGTGEDRGLHTEVLFIVLLFGGYKMCCHTVT